jgi:peptidoglycan hydrolase-like amidase
MGETTGTGEFEHTKVMTAIFRTYGYWYIKYATKYNQYGFKIRSDSGSQIYRGYDWETTYPNIKKAAQETRGIIATYDNDVALTPYSSWSDGRTRSFEERWGSTEYPWCQSVSDPYGKHPSLSTSELVAAGNHMVGLVAHGSLNLAGDDYDWSYSKIMTYYYTGITLGTNY